MGGNNMNKEDYEELEENYNKAKRMYLDSFFFQGKKMLVSYARYILRKQNGKRIN